MKLAALLAELAATGELPPSLAPADALDLATQTLEAMTALDQGMIDGRVVPAPERDARYAQLLDAGARCFACYARAHPRRADAWLDAEQPMWRRPKRFDPESWRVPAEPREPAERISVNAPEVPAALGPVLVELARFADDHPDALQLEPPAHDDELDGIEEELDVNLSAELRALYRWCDGFCWYAPGKEEPSVQMMAHDELRRWRDLDDDLASKPVRRVARIPKSSRATIEHPMRLLVFDVVNGDFVSVLCADDGEQRLIDDHTDGPTGATRKTLAEFLAHLLAAARGDPNDDWSADVVEFFDAPND